MLPNAYTLFQKNEFSKGGGARKICLKWGDEGSDNPQKKGGGYGVAAKGRPI